MEHIIAGSEWSQECLSYLAGVAAKENASEAQPTLADREAGAEDSTPSPHCEDVPLSSLLRLAADTTVSHWLNVVVTPCLLSLVSNAVAVHM